MLPLREDQPRLFLEGIDASTACDYGRVAPSIKGADLAILRISTPFQPKPEMGFFANRFHEGDLDFKDEAKAHILDLLQRIPTIVVIDLDRPAVIPEIAQACAGLLATFGASDAAVLDVIFGRHKPTAKLPFELPSSMEAVRKQKEDLPYDSENPLFPFGYGLTY